MKKSSKEEQCGELFWHCVNNNITSKDLINIEHLENECFVQLLVENLEKYEKEELRRKKIDKIIGKYER